MCIKNLFILQLLFEFSRLIKVLKQMQKKIEEIKKSEINPQDQKMFDQLEDLRSKFKQV